MKLLLIYIIISCFLVACHDNHKEPELLEMEDLIPKSSRDNYEENLDVEIPSDTLSSLAQNLMTKFTEAILMDNKEDASYFPDRLSYMERDEVNLILDEREIKLIVWKYEDSLQTLNAYYNWLDCFGKYCQSIRIGDKIRLKESKTISTWVGNKHLVFLMANDRINYKLWSAFIDKNYEHERWNLHFIQQKGSSINWIALFDTDE